MDNSNKEICIIKLMFPVDSDEQAFNCKKKAGEMLKDIPESQVDFRIISGRPPMPQNPNDAT